MRRSEMQLAERRVKLSSSFKGQQWQCLARSGKLEEFGVELRGVHSDSGFKEWHSKGATEEISCLNSRPPPPPHFSDSHHSPGFVSICWLG